MSAMVGVQNLDSEAGKKLGSASPWQPRRLSGEIKASWALWLTRLTILMIS